MKSTSIAMWSSSLRVVSSTIASRLVRTAPPSTVRSRRPRRLKVSAVMSELVTTWTSRSTGQRLAGRAGVDDDRAAFRHLCHSHRRDAELLFGVHHVAGVDHGLEEKLR